jgi:hypothetical protein
MRLLFALLLMSSVFSVSAFAEDPFLDLDGQTLYKELKHRFKDASLPASSEVEGWWAGRCISSASQRKEKGYVLTFHRDGNSSSSDLYAQIVYIIGERDPAAYDQLDNNEAVMIREYLESNLKKDTKPAFEKKGSIVSKGKFNFWKDYGVRYVRKSQDAFIVKLSFDISPDRMCYFYKKVH